MVFKAMRFHEIIKGVNAERKKRSEDGALKLKKWIYLWRLRRVAEK